MSIVPGSCYERYKGLDEGDFFTHKTCSDCLSVRNEFFCDGWVWGNVWERVEEHVFDMDGDISSDCLLRLTPRAREHVIELIDNYYGETEEEEE
jgi:hypothetical protein